MVTGTLINVGSWDRFIRECSTFHKEPMSSILDHDVSFRSEKQKFDCISHSSHQDKFRCKTKSVESHHQSEERHTHSAFDEKSIDDHQNNGIVGKETSHGLMTGRHEVNDDTSDVDLLKVAHKHTNALTLTVTEHAKDKEIIHNSRQIFKDKESTQPFPFTVKHQHPPMHIQLVFSGPAVKLYPLFSTHKFYFIQTGAKLQIKNRQFVDISKDVEVEKAILKDGASATALSLNLETTTPTLKTVTQVLHR